VVDALLAAAGLGDIGTVFGADDPAYAGRAVAVFIEGALQRVTPRAGRSGNVTCTIVAARPRIGPHRKAIRASVAALLGVADDAVNVSATTTDGLGFTGRGEGIACLAVALLRPAG
jgi:2-C-methyl-D-erythritol 2,4-cyclodiphosphate synthase